MQNTEKTVAVVGAGPALESAAAKARALGLSPVQVKWTFAPTPCEEVKEVCLGSGVSGVIAACPEAMKIAAETASALGLSNAGLSALSLTLDKPALLKSIRDAGLPVILHCAARDYDEAEEALHHWPLPVVVKPGSGASGKGTSRVDYADDLPLAFKKAMTDSGKTAVLLVPVLEGRRFSVHGIVQEGRMSCPLTVARECASPMYAFEDGVYAPPAIEESVANRLSTAAEAVVKTVGIENEAVRIDFVIHDNVACVEDVALGPGPDAREEVLFHAYGFDVEADRFRLATGEPLRGPRHRHGAAALYWISAHSGCWRRSETNWAWTRTWRAA
jgi:biotin carboxylase